MNHWIASSAIDGNKKSDRSYMVRRNVDQVAFSMKLSNLSLGNRQYFHVHILLVVHCYQIRLWSEIMKIFVSMRCHVQDTALCFY